MQKTINGYTVIFKRISNYLLYARILQSPEFQLLKFPEVPKVWNEKRKAYLENPMSPVYATEIELYEVKKNKIVIDLLLNECVDIDLGQINSTVINNIRRTRLTDNLKLAVLKYEVFKTANDINSLVKDLLLTEVLVYEYIQLVTVTRNNINLLEHSLQHPVKTTISIDPIQIAAFELVNPLHEYTACIESKMDWNTWLNNGYELEVMAYTIAMYRLNKLIEVHSQDEQQK